MSTTPLRIGAVSYLNTKPLVFGLDALVPQARIEFDLPSRLAEGLASGRLDVALIPSVEYFQDPSYRIVSDACIACRGPVLSVKLFTRVPFASIRTLALDEGSRTSVALVRILLRERFGIEPVTVPLPIGTAATATAADAVLLIGDRAMHRPAGNFVAEWDLGDQWCRWSELPFVFAMWVARRGVETDELANAFARARDEGVRHLSSIAEREAAGVGLSPTACLSYLRDNLHFYLGERERLGLELFREHAARQGLVPRAGPIVPDASRGPTRPRAGSLPLAKMSDTP